MMIRIIVGNFWNSVSLREEGTWSKINYVLHAIILSQITFHLRHEPGNLHVINVRTIMQLLIMVIREKKQINAPGKNNVGKKDETHLSNRCTEIDVHKSKISAVPLLTQKPVWSVCVLLQWQWSIANSVKNWQFFQYLIPAAKNLC